MATKKTHTDPALEGYTLRSITLGAVGDFYDLMVRIGLADQMERDGVAPWKIGEAAEALHGALTMLAGSVEAFMEVEAFSANRKLPGMLTQLRLANRVLADLST